MAEKRTLYLEAEKVRLDRLEAFLKDNIDNVKQCAVCNEYFCEEDTMMCEGGGSDTPCYLTLCSAHFARSACGCFAFCARHAAEEDEMTGEQLFWLGRALFFSNQEYYVVHRVLSLAALKGSDDAQWLLGRIHLRASGGRGAGLNVADQDPRAVAYFYMRELRVQSHHLAAPLLQQTGLGKVILANRGSRGDKIRLLSEAAAEGEPVAFALLAMCDLGQTEAQKSARKKYAADRYEFCGILNESLKREELILTIRRNLVYGLCLESTYGTDYDNRGLSDLALWTTGGVCVIGKELDGCEEIYGSALHSNVDSELFAKECIRAYRGVTHACRRACLCTVFCLRRPLGRDVATMIAKMIYRETRHDMEMWSRTQQ